MKHIYFFGECMVELRSVEESTMAQSFAGDVYNSAVYLKRCFSDIAVSVITAVGQDNLSSRMIEQFQSEEIDTSLVFRDDHKFPGLYLIETDETGERTFTYWRSDSAARQVLSHISDNDINKIAKGEMLFLSGISIAFLKDKSLSSFWDMIERLKANGVKIVFDPNYRPNLWHDKTEAKMLYEYAFRLSDIVMPGVEDMATLYGIDKAHDILDFCRPFNHEVVVINNGSQCVVTYADGQKVIHEVTPVEQVVDTTSAGDAFNGAFLGAYLSDYTISDAVNVATRAAAAVIQQPGAIVPKDYFKHAMCT